MPDYRKDALGQVVRELREREGLTQQQLGDAAGYRSGAGVSISRLEGGLLQPGSEKLAGIAVALGLTARELEDRATQRTADNEAAAEKRATAAASEDTAAGENASDEATPPTEPGTNRPKAPPGQKELNARRNKIERQVQERTKSLTDLIDDFNTQHDRARDEFFMRFADIGARIDGAEPPDATSLDTEEDLEDGPGSEAEAMASFQIRSNANGLTGLLAGGAGGAAAGATVGTAAAYGTFVAVASFGTASTGAAISGLSGIAATNATLAALGGGSLAAGGAGIAGGTMVLAGIVALPTVIICAGGLAWMAKRNRNQRQKFAALLDDAEAQLAATRPGVEALEKLLPRATETLDYIATHGGHALTRWADHLGPGTISWAALDPAAKQGYHDFSEIAGAQITIVTFSFEGLLTLSGDERDDQIRIANTVLSQSRDAVRALV